MTDRTQPESGSTHIIRYALELGLLWVDGSGRDKVREALAALDILEAELEAIGAGGVQALSASPEAIAKLRHLYQNMVNGAVRDTASAKRIAEGLLAPAIEALERATPPAEQQAAPKAAPGDEGKALAALRYYMRECSGAEPSISVFHRMVEEALGAAPQQEAQEPTAFIHWPINGPPRLVWYSQKALNDAILKTHEDGYKPDLKLYTAPQPAHAPLSDDSEDAARLAKITQAIRDYHFALDCREHGGVAMARAWNAICDVLNMDWVQGAESAARKQGANHD